MKLICGVTYNVAVILPSGHIMTTPMEYCGGSWVEETGHHIAFGIWSKGRHPRHKQFGTKRNHNNFIPCPGTGRTEQNKYDDEGKSTPIKVNEENLGQLVGSNSSRLSPFSMSWNLKKNYDTIH